VATHRIRELHDGGPVKDREERVPRHVALTREQVFARDSYACVYCGAEGTAETLSVDHVQPRVRGGDHSAGNVVTACMACNARKGHRRHAEFLADEPEAWRHFRQRASYVWPRHLEAVTAELSRRSRKKRETRTNLRG
jgi:5-methylcytosine-specific restriction endonuclease McrA